MGLVFDSGYPRVFHVYFVFMFTHVIIQRGIRIISGPISTLVFWLIGDLQISNTMKAHEPVASLGDHIRHLLESPHDHDYFEQSFFFF
jgi:hypothetical protein